MTKVTLREKPLQGGMIGYYIDIYPTPGGMTRFHNLKIVTVAKPSNKIEREHKAIMEAKAKEICQRMEIAFITGQDALSLIEKNKGLQGKNEDFFKFIEKERRNLKESWRRSWSAVANQFKKFTNRDKFDLESIDLSVVDEFRNYLINDSRSVRTNKPLSQNSKANYFEAFRAILNKAYRNGIISVDLANKVDGISSNEVNRIPISRADLKTLFATNCKDQQIKDMAMISVLSGLRFSDISKLKRKDIKWIDSLNSFAIDYTQTKTGADSLLPTPEKVLDLVPTNGFTVDYFNMQRDFKKWLQDAGLQNSNITFHSFRHTFAALQIEAGTDIFTLSALMGHKSVQTTQVYAKATNANKARAGKAISLNFNF